MVAASDEHRHVDAVVEEWVFECWATDGSLGAVHGQRIVGRRQWYWVALVRAGRPLLRVADWDVPTRADAMLIKGDGLWAELTCDDPLRQWSVANETYADQLDDPDEALGRGYGTPTPIAFDWEWYAASEPVEVTGGYVQAGSVHGLFEIVGEPRLILPDMAARRWHRWGDEVDVSPPGRESDGRVSPDRAPFRFPGDEVVTWMLASSPPTWAAV